jgi:hypothetical protein
MIRLSNICLFAFLTAAGIFVHAWLTQGDIGFAFLLMGALGCVYLLLLTEQHYNAQLHYRSMPARLREIHGGALPAMARESATPQRRPQPAGIPDRRRHADNSRWPGHLERRKSARPTLAPIC